MFAIVPVALMALLAFLAPRYGHDSRPGFTDRPDRG